MSYVYSDDYQPYLAPVQAETSTGGSSCTWWIVLFVLFLLVAIGLGIWLLVLYLGGHVSGGSDRTLTVNGASITAEATTVTGTWGTLNSDNDKVTLYVSEKPFVFNDQGQVVNVNGSVLQDFKIGSNGKIDISVKNNTSYNAMMIVSSDDTVHYRVFGPKKVFTQVEANITGHRFHIQDLNSCNGAVSETATYTTAADSFGQYRLGSENNTSQDSKSLLLRYDEAQDTETEQVLCRAPTATTQVTFGYWVNKTSTTAKPMICSVPNATDTAATCDTPSNNIALENCQWSYNSGPSQPNNMAGLNQWCLSAAGTTTINSSIKEPLCLARNGQQALTVVNGQTNNDTWFNQLLT